MGLCAISLWTLGVRRRRLGLVPWTRVYASVLRASVRRICGRRWIWRWFRRRLGWWNRLVTTRLGRTVPSVVSHQQRLCAQREHHEYADHERQCPELESQQFQ